MLLIAAPGSGKSTIAKRIERIYKLTHICSGDLFRAHIANGTDLGKQVEKIMSDGNLVDDDLTMQVLGDSLSKINLK